MGDVVPDKIPPSNPRDCSAACEKGGCINLSLAYVHSLFHQFYGLTYNEQSLLLLKFISLREPRKRRTGKSDSTSTRQASFDYSLNGKPVCRKTLCNTFAITPRRIQILQQKMKDGQLAPKDKRGTHLNRRHAIDATVRGNIREHIESFPIEVSHYSRNVSSKKCLSPDFSLSKMYRLFKQKYPDNPANSTLYSKIFKREFNLRFGNPRSDTCKQCDQFYAKLVLARNEEERKSIEVDSHLHHCKADQAYKTLSQDSANRNAITICVDLQQVLFTPMLTHGDVYYQSQYSTYNLAIHNMTDNVANMFVWHESLAKRGSKEIGSCILRYITSTYRPLPPGQERRLIVWSDLRTGQNNNWNTLILYWYLVKMRYFTEIHQKFLITGHSFLPCDRDFALIEKAKKRVKALVPGDWKHVISGAKLNKPFIVFEMDQSDFKDIEALSPEKPGKKIMISKFVCMKITAEDPVSLYVRESHNILRPWISEPVFPTRLNPCDIKDLPNLYSALLPISKEKKDLMTMVQYLTDPDHRAVYETLPSFSGIFEKAECSTRL